METNTCEFLDKKLTQILNLDVLVQKLFHYFFGYLYLKYSIYS